MAPDGKAEHVDHGDRNATATLDTSAAEAELRARLSRKRTKSGCLTCRKRRIKCSEEKPICRNCVKSKRQCGYNQPVVFRSPPVDYRPGPHGGAHINFHAGPPSRPAAQYDLQYGHAMFNPAYHSHSLPRTYVHHAQNPPQSEATYGSSEYHQSEPTQVPQAPHSAAPHQVYLGPPDPAHEHAVLGPYHPNHGHLQHSNYPAHSEPFIVPAGHMPHMSQNPSSGESHANHYALWQPPHPGRLDQKWALTSPATSATAEKISPTSSMSSKTMGWSQSSVPDMPAYSGWANCFDTAYVPRPELCRPIDYQRPPIAAQYTQQPLPPTAMPAFQPQNGATPNLYEHLGPSPNDADHFLKHAAVETQDDNYYDVQSDEEMDIETAALTAHDHGQLELHRILEINNISIQALQARRYDTFLYDGILDHYRIEHAANPLRNPATVRVFAHFISATGPLLSIFERHPRNASVLFTEGQIPFSQQGLWTYAMPVAALHHQGLLHAMLALASLHIARLQNASDTPSRMHYAWACKRINHLLGPKSQKRHKTTTIAASMLLGFYEIFTADHRQWNMHLMGSKQLFLETDFVGLTRQFRWMKSDRAARQHFGDFSADTQLQDEILDQIPDIDDRVISQLVGKEVNYEEHGRIMTPQSSIPPDLDLSNFEILKDLYWWYLKQDVYQSIVSGNPLLLDYSRFANCPPRAPLGKSDAVYGSFDHLILLLGRIADFAAKGRRLKLKQMEANGNQWKPGPGVQASGPPQQPQVTGPQPNGTPKQPQPQFFGMAPPPRQNVQMPSSYYPANNGPPQKMASPDEPIDLQAATEAALEEYGRIRAALHTFCESLGEAFQPLSPEFQPPLETPFGPALFYRSYDIGCLWSIYYMAVIIAIRSHPNMHPAAHAAAAIASQETAFFANEIGRINAAIVPGPPDQPLNPTLGASLCESCMPAFFAAVQYRSPQQRHATVMRIYNIALRTGWGSAELIANGCETAWVKAADAGRGPPYTRVVRPEYSDDPRLNREWEVLNGKTYDRPNEVHVENTQRPTNMNAEARLTWAIGVLGMEEDEKVKSTK